MDSGRIMKELRELQEGVKNVSIQIGSLDKSGKDLDQHRKKAKKTENYKLHKKQVVKNNAKAMPIFIFVVSFSIVDNLSNQSCLII